MKRTPTFLMMLFAMLLLAGTTLSAQTEVWNKTYDWNTAKNYRGVAYNVLNNHLYVAGTEGNYADNPAGTTVEANKIQVIDAATGDVLSTLSPASAMGGDWGWGIRDVEVDMDGGIYATIATTNQFNPVQLYYWEDEEADPVMLWKDDSGTADDFGPGFSVYGRLDGDALIMIPFTNVAKVYYNEIVDGEPQGVQTLDLGVTHGKLPTVTALGTKISDGFWYNNMDLTGPVKLDGSGAVVATVPAEVFTTGLNGDVKPFSAGAMDYLVISDSGKVVTLNITGKAADLSDVSAADVLATVDGTGPVDGSGWPSIHGYGQEEAVVVSPAGNWAIYSLSGGFYVKALADEAAPMLGAAELDGSPVVGAEKEVDYVYIDFNGDAEGTSVYAWFLADDAMGTNKTPIAAAAGADKYTLVAGDAGKYLSYTVQPVAATGTVSDAANLAESNYLGPILTEETAPVAGNVAIAGEAIVFETLTGSYDFSDAGGDAEGETMFTWYRADDAAGTNALAVASGSTSYVIVPEDDTKFILFGVTPVSETGWPLIGEEVTAVTAEAVLFPPMPPEALDLAISGREDVAAPLTGSYTYLDKNGDEEAESILKWYRADNADGDNPTMVAEGTDSYTVAADDEGKVILFEVTPVSVATVGHDTGVVVFVATDTIQPEPPEYAPKAKDVELTAVPGVRILLSGSYVYEDTIVGDPEGASKYKWYSCDDADGANPVVIAGATDQTYLVQEGDLGKHFIFEVTPVALTGGLLEGDPVQSAPTATAAEAYTHEFGLERLWKGSVMDGASPWYLNHAVTTERGMAVGEDHIYIAARDRVLIVDKEDGSYVGELDMDGVEGGLFLLQDVEVSDDGQILGVPLAINESTFWVWKWEDELSKPEKWLEITLSAADMRLGDKFTVTGDVSADAVVYAVKNEGNILIRWTVTGGVASEGEEVVFGEVGTLGTAPAVAPFSTDADANLLIDGKGFVPTVFDKDGNILGSIAKVDDYTAYKIQSNSPNLFSYKGRSMAAFFQAMRKEPLGARIIVADVTAPPYQIVDTTEYVSNSMAWDGYLGEVDVTADEDFYYAYLMQAKHALAAYKGTLELPLFTSAITSFEGDMVHAFFDKAIGEIDMTEAEPWTIMAADAAIAIDTMYVNAEEGITFELATAITEGTAVSLEYDGTGTIASFNGLPLAAFGPEDVENIVGSDLPVAADVSISGTPQPGQELAGEYVFSDPDGDLEGESKYQWYEADNAEGTGALKLLGETNQTYTVADDMGGKFVAFEVTPVSATGGEDYLEGEPVKSAFVKIVGVNVESITAGKVAVYPNPVAGMLTVDNCEGYASVAIVDVTGKVQMQAETMGESRMELDMSDLARGVYFVKLINEDGHSDVLRVVKAQ